MTKETDEYQLIQTDRDALELLKELKRVAGGMIAVDTETSGTDWHERMLGFSVAWKDKNDKLRSAYVPVGHLDSLFSKNCPMTAAKRVMAELTSSSLLVFHNSLFDLRFIKRTFDLYPKLAYMDTLIVARLFNLESGWEKRGRPSLELVDLWVRHVGKGDEERAELQSYKKSMRKDLAKLPPEEVAAYAEWDARMTYELGEQFWPIIADNSGLWERERQFVDLTFDICWHGLLLNEEKARIWIQDYRKYQQDLLLYFVNLGYTKPKPSSHKWTSKILYEHLGLKPLGFTASGAPSTKVDYLRPYEQEHPEVRAVVCFRQYEKVITSWLEPFLEMARLNGDGRVHPLLDPAGTVSSRMACKRPNLQAIPMKDDRNLIYGSMRGIFTAPEDAVLLEFDYGQADLRMATCYAADNEMAAAFESTDPYVEMGRRILQKEDISGLERFWAKQTVLGAMNWVTAEGLTKHGNLMKLGVGEDLTITQAEELIARFKSFYPDLVKAGYRAKHAYDKTGNTTLWTGRKLKLGNYENPSVAWSRIIQGGVAEMVKKAMMQTEALLRSHGSKSKIVLQIHDSIILEFCKEDRPLVPEIRALMREALPEPMRTRTDPPIIMKVDVERWDR